MLFFFEGLEVTHGADELFQIRQGLPVRLQLLGIVRQEVVLLVALGLGHLVGRRLRHSGHRRVHVHDAVDDPTHGKQIINRQENNGHQDESHNR